MRISSLAKTFILTTLVCMGCTDSDGASPVASPDASPDVSPDAGKADTAASSEPFAIEGLWLFLGPTGPGHEITISSKSIKYKGTESDWESNWTIKKYDNELHNFQLVYESGHGSAYPTGERLSGTYEATDIILSVQLAQGLDAYQPVKNPDSCMNESEPIADCKRYMKMQ